MANKKAWNYGDSGDRFPVAVGDVWEVGPKGHRRPHLFLCGDLEQGAATRLLELAGGADVAYTDPPWNAGNARTFRTKAKADGDDGGRVVDFFGSLIPIVVGALAAVQGDIGIEFGVGTVDQMEAIVRAQGGRVIKRSSITYYAKHPCTFTQVRFGDGDPVAIPKLDGLDEPDAAQVFVSAVARPGQTLFDPCIGRGLAAMVAMKAGLRVIGTELHPRRLAVTIDKLCAADPSLVARKAT